MKDAIWIFGLLLACALGIGMGIIYEVSSLRQEQDKYFKALVVELRYLK